MYQVVTGKLGVMYQGHDRGLAVSTFQECAERYKDVGGVMVFSDNQVIMKHDTARRKTPSYHR